MRTAYEQLRRDLVRAGHLDGCASLIWRIVCWMRPRYTDNYGPFEAVSAAWLGYLQAVRTWDGDGRDALSFEGWALMNMRYAIRKEILLTERCHTLDRRVFSPKTQSLDGVAQYLSYGESVRYDRDQFERFWRRIPEEQQAVARLFFLNEIPCPRIARLLNMPLNKVYRITKSVRERLNVPPGVLVVGGRGIVRHEKCLDCDRTAEKAGRCTRCYQYRRKHQGKRSMDAIRRAS